MQIDISVKKCQNEVFLRPDNLENQTRQTSKGIGKEKQKEPGERKKGKRLKKSMVAPLVFILSGYFSQFAVFAMAAKKMPSGNGFTWRP